MESKLKSEEVLEKILECTKELNSLLFDAARCNLEVKFEKSFT